MSPDLYVCCSYSVLPVDEQAELEPSDQDSDGSLSDSDDCDDITDEDLVSLYSSMLTLTRRRCSSQLSNRLCRYAEV